jgi:hypothetical protein
MASGDRLFHLKVKVKATGGEAEAAVVALAPRTVAVKINPGVEWDSEALRHLSLTLDVVARTLALRSSGK